MLNCLQILVAPILEKGQTKRDVYLPNSMPVSTLTPSSLVQNSDVQKSCQSFSSYSQSTFTRSSSKSVSPDDNATSNNDMIDEAVVWKQMGTAKYDGRLFEGGKWLKDIEVQT